MSQFLPSRRLFLGGLSALAAGRTRLAFAAAPGARRVVVGLLRGAMDGLAAVPPYGDAGLAGLRAARVRRIVRREAHLEYWAEFNPQG